MCRQIAEMNHYKTIVDDLSDTMLEEVEQEEEDIVMNDMTLEPKNVGVKKQKVELPDFTLFGSCSCDKQNET